ncbi:tetratricopeptide repeat protein [Bdellovibrio bacteriovorus]|uniref:tetratricopeptide repeat protein n=1 Tax=Bdellovibrio bacteriovorus TaxID=959 RepID=UPI0035A6C1CB
MRPSFKTTASAALLLTLTACASTPAKKPTAPEKQTLVIPAAKTDAINARAEADYNFIMGDVLSREGKSEQAVALFEKVAALDPNSAAVQMRLSAEYLKIGKVKEAIQKAEQAVAKDSKNVESLLVLGGLYSAEKSYDKAIAQYQAVLRLEPKNSEAPIYIGSLYADKKEFKKAEQYFNSLLKDPNYETPYEVLYYIGLTHLDQEGAGHQKAAEAAFKKALTIKPGFEDALMALANLYLQQNNRGKALSLCLEYQKQENFSPKVADLITQIYLEDGDSEKAYSQLELITGNSESSLDVQMKMALLLIEQKRFNQAGAKLKDIVTQHPTADSARYYLAAVQEETGDMENAVRNYMQVPHSSKHFSEAIVHAAHLLKGQGKLNQALVVTKKGLQTNADKPQVYTMYASLLDAKADYLGAAQVLEQGLSKYSKNVELLFQHALILDRLGKKENMIAQMKKVLEIEPNHVQSLSYLAFSLAELNQHLPEAERLARRALELDPKDGYVLDTLGWVLFKQKRFSESIQVLEKAHEYQASASIIAEHLADAYSMESQTDKAKQMYEKAASLTTDEKRANKIRGKLRELSVKISYFK